MGTKTPKNATEQSKEDKKGPASSVSLSKPISSETETSSVVASKNEPKLALFGMNQVLYGLFKSLPPNFLGYHRLPKDIFNIIRQYLSISDVVSADAVRKLTQEKLLFGKKSFFKVKPDEKAKFAHEAKLALPLLHAVISGNLGANPEEENEHSLMNLVRNNPPALFMKGDVSFPNGCDVYLLPTIPQDLSKYKGHYIWANEEKLIYVHFNSTREDVVLDNAREFNQTIQSLPKEQLNNEESVVFTNKQINELITQRSQNQHKPVPHQRFYDVSPFQLMNFFCDDDMQNQIMPLIPSAFQDTIKVQLKELGTHGAADIVKVNRNPLDPNFRFEDILHYKTSYIVDYDVNNTPITQEATHSLLEKPKGIIYCKDPSGQVHWYRADVSTQSIETLDNPLDHPDKKNVFSQKDQQDFSDMVEDIDKMEDMSSEQSSQRKRHLISKILGYDIHAEGINFELEGISFKSGCYDFNRQDNAYRKCHRLYKEKKWTEGDKTWCEELGHRQKECAWKLQRLCEENRPLYPFPENYKNTAFRRGFYVNNWAANNIESLLVAARHFARGLGSVFAIYKGRASLAAAFPPPVPRLDLVAGTRLVEDAKANMIRQDDLTPPFDLAEERPKMPP